MTPTAISVDMLRAKLAPTPALLEVARRAVWFQPPAATLADPLLFLAHLMTYTLASDVMLIENRLTRREIGWVLDHAPAGIFDSPSWHFWHARIGREDILLLPQRVVPDLVQHKAESQRAIPVSAAGINRRWRYACRCG